MPADLIDDPAVFAGIAGFATVLVEGAAFRCELVASSERESWLAERKESVCDERIQYDSKAKELGEVLEDSVAQRSKTRKG